MADKLALGLVIGGAVSASVGRAFKDVESRIGKLEATGAKARVLQRTIGDTIRLREEWRQAHLTGAEGASKLLTRLNANLESLRAQGVQVGKLNKEYQALGRTARSAELKALGRTQVKDGVEGLKHNVGEAAAGAAAMAIPTKVSADYSAIIRDIAIKAGIARTAQETQMSKTIIGTSRDQGMGRNEVAEVVNNLVGAGMDLKEALSYAPTAAKFVVGQGADGADTAKMINALGQNAKITDPEVMQRALEAIAYQGQAGSFEASDMARWFPEMLASMGKLGITGMDAVTQLGSMLQVQMKTAGGADEAANNLKNWMEKIGSSDTVTAYKKAGIDYEGSMQTGLQNGLSTLESSFALAQHYIQQTDPKRAAAMAEATAKISKEADPTKAKAMMASLEQALRTGDIFADMQVKAALTAFMQNKALYEQLKKDSKDANGILDKNLSERRDASAQKWAEMAHAMDDSMRAIGDAIAPMTDRVAQGITAVASGLGKLADEYPRAVSGAVALGGALIGIRSAINAFKIGRGLLNIGKGTLMGNPNIPQKVIVMNMPAGGAGGPGDLGGAGGESDKKGKGGGKGGKSGRAGKGVGVLAMVDAAYRVKDVYDNATTRDEKAEGYGGAVGAGVGGWAGAAAGAAAGSVVPVVGTAVGALVGGALGAYGGDALGGAAGKALFGGPEPDKSRPSPLVPVPLPGPAIPSLSTMARSFGPTPAAATAPAAGSPVDPAGGTLGDVVRAMSVPARSTTPGVLPPMSKLPMKVSAAPPKVEQTFTITAPISFQVHGDVKDAATLAAQLQPYFQQQLRDIGRQLSDANLFDSPHVG